MPSYIFAFTYTGYTCVFYLVTALETLIYSLKTYESGHPSLHHPCKFYFIMIHRNIASFSYWFLNKHFHMQIWRYFFLHFETGEPCIILTYITRHLRFNTHDFALLLYVLFCIIHNIHNFLPMYKNNFIPNLRILYHNQIMIKVTTFKYLHKVK